VDLGALNRTTAQAAVRELLACCASEVWAEEMAARRPFVAAEDVLTAAAAVWWTLGEEDWLQAFAAHPRIGERRDGDDRHNSWSRSEQSGAIAPSAAVGEALAACNREYEARFGHVYMVFATGKSAEELLDLCRARLDNDPDEEFLVAAAEQAKITELRLRKLLAID